MKPGDFLDGITTANVDFFGVNLIFKLLFFLVLIGYVFYAFMLTLRVRILTDTLNTDYAKFVTRLTYAHLILSIVGSFLAFIILLLA